MVTVSKDNGPGRFPGVNERQKNMKRIEVTSPLYLNRIVRELNGSIDGFYAMFTENNCHRCNRARLSKGRIEVKSLMIPGWFAPASGTFSDAYGRTICASTEA